ncbi:uncharacterized protein MONBRDRAFT_34062 [Monosiga brevicollis MX1]|uniref:Uncharacterized protein n=1 Tax=Monosiga brevicollis TaxID=81824 RepID=A9V992_MONBE|nr:uncharacterized protein MONBRDRAFT_34062 [Monosiga brevicollis MX1]EDQ85820.1 predicted protein [Monosiga brevicollis MX1]|eukprot:XP_001749299.1 hypothetical protein [Monosiga brevicollis MX1]
MFCDIMWLVSAVALVVVVFGTATTAQQPQEPVSISWLPLPPTAPSTEPGACSSAVNPRYTGCLTPGRGDGLHMRSFTWDGNHVLVGVTMAGSPAPPSPGSNLDGPQLILIKTDGTTFSNGDAWKCLTCGVPSSNRVGADLIDDACTPNATHIYAIQSPFPAYPAGGLMRELRLHPDNVHLGWSQLLLADQEVMEYSVFGRLTFDAAAVPPVYKVSHVNFLLSPNPHHLGRMISIKSTPNGSVPGELSFGPAFGVIGELRGFTSDGGEALGIGTFDSFNYDIFATNLHDGTSRRLTVDPAYTDPVVMSPDDSSFVIMDGRVNDRTGLPGGFPQGEDGRMYFASAAPGVPPLIDLAISSAASNLYNLQYGSPGPTNPRVEPTDLTGGRRYFQPYILNLTGDGPSTSLHDGQQLNAGADATPGSGSFSDPLWNGGADAAWSPDGTAIAFYQLLVAPPACNDSDARLPPCPTSREPGGRFTRVMLAKLTSRTPKLPPPQPAPVSDIIPWGTPWKQGDPFPAPLNVPSGSYVLRGESGSATVELEAQSSAFGGNRITAVNVTYHHFSADGINFVDGAERAVCGSNPTSFAWHENLTLSGKHTGSRTTSPNGFVVTSPGLSQPPLITGTLTTTLDGLTFTSPEQ